MAKKGVKKISGPAVPRVGQPASYSVTEWYPGTPDALKANVTWVLFKKRSSGQYTSTKISKTGPVGTFTFGESAVNADYKVEGYLFNPELSGPSTIHIKPTHGPPNITGISMYTSQGEKFTTPAKYGQKIIIAVQTVNMIGEDLTISLWERDTISDQGHDNKVNTKLWEQQLTVENKSGIVKTKLLLSLNMAVQAGAEWIEGSSHEYYVLVKANNLLNYSKQQLDVSSDTSDYAITKALQEALEVQGVDNNPPPENENSPTTIGEEKEEDKDNTCPRCESDFTFEDINKICVNRQGKSLIKDSTKIKEALTHLNKYKDKAGLNTCTKKAHFLAQLSQESKFYDLAEGFNYYWQALISTFSKFQTAEGKAKAKLWGRQVKSRNQPNYSSVPENKQILIASWAYKDRFENGNFESRDGWKFRGRGFKQITWRSNYRSLSAYFNSTMKLDGDTEVNWEANPELLTTRGKDAILSALAYWTKNGINAVATGASDDDVTQVTRKINPALKGLDERKRFFKKAVEVLKVNQCNPGTLVDEMGTVVLVSGQGAKTMKGSVVYETKVYKNMTLNTFKELKESNDLPKANHTTYFARDAHGEKKKYGKHSSKRYGFANECPPGEYYLIPSVPGQLYKLYVGDNGVDTLINGVHGKRSGIAFHQYRPLYAIGCLTSCTGRDLSVVNTLLDHLDDLPLKDNKPVRLILEERKVTESQWPNPAVGTTKWTGVL
ncbi:glycoside hydrolase family 19 protein [Bizionia paragorgiae]|uniref:Predicted chitinase n=1 Tax=Bizionia paragorgiae TaxID=283786 RepID=A0A1H4AZB7_BIZPA|nr:hypothetical protein [Bizionia paragorgiae]SEA41127.1 Predicted chitinase [Bizionia paragorgiae]